MRRPVWSAWYASIAQRKINRSICSVQHPTNFAQGKSSLIELGG
jgi:hypothetical protein